MGNKLKEVSWGVVPSLIASYLYSLLPQIDMGEKSSWLGKMIENNNFLLNWILFFVLFIIIRWFIRKVIEKLQTPAPFWFGVGKYNKELYEEIYGFNWMIHADVTYKDPFNKEKLDVYVGQVDGPYCKNDDREMKISRTYFGRYKYKCPKCGYKKILLKNRWTLENDIKDEFEALARKQLRNNQ
ncbi:hypothetical protein COK00_12640 [Bacillus cereus]|uniref:hypothetical protein n=1 Tax=Bacillus cereus TaxID=1396 RepID=UPI000BFA0716|nr:hypothetical protein [Bacillus cereus]PEX37911.1 hypothetical protein CN455_15140 [Bacillus cereus]PFB19622.1 hypothetical protein CN399_01025 [Bacillus cereus]PFP64818.1 hypothetical protein COK00_12640 [Bacillus cereus]PFV57617.1 hypothetical protein COL09_14775 [Bacillus cereus]